MVKNVRGYDMDISTAPDVIDVITDFLSVDPTPQEILEFQLPLPLLQRITDLLERNRDDTLSHDEHLEMENFLRMEHFMTMLKLKTRMFLSEKR
jgi:hypothetical protein